MARPRAASDEDIIATANELATEIGWRNVYAKTVYEKMNVGGSLSTFSKVIKAWRGEREAEAGAEKTDIAEIVEDRASIIDDGIGEIADTLKKLRDTVNAEIDRAVSDERRKSEHLRTDDRTAHEKVVQELRGQIDALSAEIGDLAAEASSECDRADFAEKEVDALSAQITDTFEEMAEFKKRAQEIPDLEKRITNLIEEVKDEKTRADNAWVRVRELEKLITPTATRK